MRNGQITLRRAAAAVFVTLLAVGLSRAQNAGAPAAAVVVQGTTTPFTHAKPSVNQYGTVMKLPVKRGQLVKEGDLLLQQDDREERAELARLELEAASNVRVEASDADLKLKDAQLKRLLAMPQGVASIFEIEEARSKVIAADAQAKIARLELEKAKQEAIRQRAKVDKMSLTSKSTGRIEAIDVEVGDICDPQKPVMTIVQNDPLKVDFYLPVNQAAKLKLGDKLQVRYPTEDKWVEAVVDFKSPFADAASGTQKIGLSMKNPEGRDSGMEVQVRLPADAGGNAAAAAR